MSKCESVLSGPDAPLCILRSCTLEDYKCGEAGEVFFREVYQNMIDAIGGCDLKFKSKKTADFATFKISDSSGKVLGSMWLSLVSLFLCFIFLCVQVYFVYSSYRSA